MNRQRIQLETDIDIRSDGEAVLWAKLSATRMGEQDKQSIKEGEHQDYLAWYPIFFGKNEETCKKWLDTNRGNLIKKVIPYEV